MPIKEVVIKPGALNDLAEILKPLNLGKQGMIVADSNTLTAAGDRILKVLGNVGYTLKLSLFNTSKPIHADESALEKVLFDLEPSKTSFLIAAGSGSIPDITRMISSRTGIPFISVPTP